MANAKSFRVGKVQGYLRGKVWYLCYHDQGQRRRPRVGGDREAARQMAAQINGQVEVGAPAALSFEQVTVPQLRSRWLEHHEHVLRSSVHSINRYRTATDHLLRFIETRPVKHASLFTASNVEEFVRYLRTVKVSPNGHPNTPRRVLMDKGILNILQACQALFAFAVKRRHLSPYAENPFKVVDIDRIPVENARSIVLMTPEEEVQFLDACDDYQVPIFATLMLTGMRPSELCYLILPDDLDLESAVLHIRNKPQLGWQVKKRCQREVPLLPELVAILRTHLGDRHTGPVFLRRKARSCAKMIREQRQQLDQFCDGL